MGIYPTRTVWIHKPYRNCGIKNQWIPDVGITLEDEEYKHYCLELNDRGIEFALHSVSSGNNTREEVIGGFQVFKEIFGYYPRLYLCHSINAEHPYWGENQYKSAFARSLVRSLTGYGKEEYSGHDPQSPYYWSDFCKETVHYIRLYRTRKLNVLRYNPMMPYHQYDKPDVRFWFSASAHDVKLCKRITSQSLDQVAGEDGAIIHYAHLAQFVMPDDSSRVKPPVKKAFQIISARSDCWCAGVSRILDRCLAIKNILVNVRKHGIVLTNPTAINVEKFQIQAGYQSLYLPSGEALHPDEEQRFLVGTLAPYSCTTLFFSKEAAFVGDPVGNSPLEQIRMMIETAKVLKGERRFRISRFQKLRPALESEPKVKSKISIK
jgi:hypothetical protein